MLRTTVRAPGKARARAASLLPARTETTSRPAAAALPLNDAARVSDRITDQRIREFQKARYQYPPGLAFAHRPPLLIDDFDPVELVDRVMQRPAHAFALITQLAAVVGTDDR